MDLVELNLSGQKFDKLNIQALTVIVEMSTKLEKLVLKECNLDYFLLETILESFVVNEKLKGVAVDFSKNDLKLAGANVISEYFPKLTGVSSLNLSECKLKSEGMATVFTNLHKMRNLKGLDISCNLKMSSLTINILKTIADAVADPSLPLETLVIRGDEKRFIGSDLYSIFLVMSQSQVKIFDPSFDIFYAFGLFLIFQIVVGRGHFRK
jgi:Ran GTPase-activating protein (RanGAP) involved in mRNA processing and transport